MKKNKSLSISIAKPLIFFLLLGLVISEFVFNKYNEEIAIKSSVDFAKKNVEQYLALRKYYTENVVSVVKEHSDISIRHQSINYPKSIPSPSTLIHEISEELYFNQENIRMMVYSQYPFPNSISRKLDLFQDRAINAISNGEKLYFKRENINGNDTMRVAIPDFFSSPGCISCHNNLEFSPKKDWKLNDIAGVIQIDLPISLHMKIMQSKKIIVLLIQTLLFILITCLIFYEIRRKVIIPIKEIESSLNHVEEGKLINLDNKHKINEFSNLKKSINNVSNNLSKKITDIKSESEKRKKTQEKLESLNSELECLVDERTLEINNKNKKMQEKIRVIETAQKQLVDSEKMAALGSMVAGISHEINTPIGTALTAQTHLSDRSENIFKKIADDDLTKEEFDEYIELTQQSLQLINSNLCRAAELIKSFKQVSVDQTIEDLREFNLDNLLNDCSLMMSPNLRNGQHNIKIECDKELIMNGYPGILSQIIINLINNSILHGFEGLENKSILINVIPQEKEILLVYKDNGVGMSEEQISNVFEPFYTTKRANGGTGLGMSISFNLVVQKLKGKIICTSELGKFTEFTLTLPLEVN